MILVHLDGIRSVYCVFVLIVNDAAVFNWIVVMRDWGCTCIYNCIWCAKDWCFTWNNVLLGDESCHRFVFPRCFLLWDDFAFILLILFFDAVLLLLFRILRRFAPVFLLFLFIDFDGGTFLLIKMAYHLLVRICLFCFTWNIKSHVDKCRFVENCPQCTLFCC